MTAILLRRERGRNNAEMYAVLVVTPPPPLQREVTFQKGGRNDARVRYMRISMHATVDVVIDWHPRLPWLATSLTLAQY